MKNKEELLNRLSQIETEVSKLRKELKQALPLPSKEDRFLELIQSIDKVKIGETIVYFKDEQWMLEIQKSTLWVNYTYIWSIFYTEYNMSYEQVQAFIKCQVEEHLKCEDLMPLRCHDLYIK